MHTSARLGPKAWLGTLGGPCLVCRDWGRGALCDACLARWAAPAPRCRRCGLRCGVPLASCGDCLRQPPPQDATVVLGDYGFPWDRLLADFKFRAQPDLAEPLAALLAAAVLRAGLAPPQAILPVPLSDERLRERGFNQAWELARRLPTALGQPARAEARWLLRLRDTPHQAELNRAQRLDNLRQAFLVEPRHAVQLAGKRVALVDDVMTTGATAAAAALCLKAAGAAEVQLWVLARTPAPGAH